MKTVESQTVATVPTTQEQDERFHMPSLGKFKACSLIIGLLLGFFIYLSTLGAEFIAVMMFGKDILDKTNNHQLVWFSLGWNFVTTLIALVVLTAMRRLVVSVFTATASESRSETNVEDIAAELLSHLEGRFAVGALVGICLTWNVINIVLGMRPQVIQSCVILSVACLWCRLTLVLLGQPTDRALIYDKKEETEEEEPKYEDDKLEPLIRLV